MRSLVAVSMLGILFVSCALPQSARAQSPSPKLSYANKSQPASDKCAFEGEGSGILIAMRPRGKKGQCPLQHTDVKANISGYVARVSVKQVFKNTFSEKIEAVYTFPLPENAAVDEMIMKVGDRIIKGNIKKREEARVIYENAKTAGNVASLLNQERSNVFIQSVANIEPGATVEIEIKYVDLLPYEKGEYSFSFPTVVGPRFSPGNSRRSISPPLAPRGQRAGHDISIALDIDAAMPINSLASALHEVSIDRQANKAHIELLDKNTIPNKDFVFRWTVASDKLQSGYLAHKDSKSGYFTLMLMPPKKVTPETVAPKEMVFLIDCSGSQSGPPLQKAKETMEYILDHMNPNDTFQIVVFSDYQDFFSEHPQRASAAMKAQAKKFIRGLEANGGTWVAPAVEKVCAMPSSGNRLRIVTFMTDGLVDNDMEVLGMIKKYRGKSRWFSFGTGDGVNRALIDGIAKEGGGEAEYVLLNSAGSVVGKKFYDRISSPVLTDVKIDFKGLDVKEVYPREVSDVWAEKPLYIKGRYLKPGAGTISLTGFAGGKPYKQDLQVVFPDNEPANEVIKPIWARAKVDRLMSEDWFGAQLGKPNKELKDEIVRTALQHHIMTQYTSFVAVEEKRVTRGGASKTVEVAVELPHGISRKAVSNELKSSSHLPCAPLPCAPMAVARGSGASAAGINFSAAAVMGNKMAPSMGISPYFHAPNKSDGGKAGIGIVNIGESDAVSGADTMSFPHSEPHLVDTPHVNAARRKLDARLLPLLNAKTLQSAINNKALEVVGGAVTLKLTLSDLSPETVSKLRAHGFEVLKSNYMEKRLVGKIQIHLLESLAEFSEVVKVEPARAGS